MEISIQELMDRLPGAYLPDKAGAVDVRVQFHLTGEKGGDWYVALTEQGCSVASGETENPSLVFSAEAQDCLDVFTGKLDPVRAYMSGKLALRGDMSLAMRLMRFFSIEKLL